MESEYKNPIEVSLDDPICAVSGIPGTIIGILFDKSGAQIDNAIASRLEVITKELGRYDKVVDVATEFLTSKKKEVEKLEKLYTRRAEEKDSQSKPFERKIRDIQKEWCDKVVEFDKVTEKQLAGEAVNFEKGFDDFEKTFEQIDVLVEEEEKVSQTSRRLIRSMSSKSLSSTSGSSGVSNSTDFASSAYTLTSDDNASNALLINTTEDKALARLNNLKQLLTVYINKLRQLSGKVNDLKAEQRRLVLIKNNLDAGRTYKLDLNKLSAFGFEDIKIKEGCPKTN